MGKKILNKKIQDQGLSRINQCEMCIYEINGNMERNGKTDKNKIQNKCGNQIP